MNMIGKLGEFSLKAMLYEISSYPSPGLVSPVSSGAHRDMDYFTFLNSISSLDPYMYKFAKAGYCDKSPKEIFKDIREIGKDAEKVMLESTKGINTHKGMIFLMGISLAASSKAIYEHKEFDYISTVIKQMTEGIVQSELLNKNASEKCTYGEKIFDKYGITGVRGEVEEGLPIIFEKSLKYYREKEYLTEKDRLVQTLVYIMCYCEDTNILHRRSMEKLTYVHEAASEAIELGGVETIEGRSEIENLDYKFSKEGISPGGSADLLAITVYFSLLKDFMEKEELDEK